jgi:23S rRNA (adenine2030-N6)-methyltransferase
MIYRSRLWSVPSLLRTFMNYRHAFHAGNFADVFKHLILIRILVYLKRKETAFRFIDTHAGHGLYDLSSEEAERTDEWRNGVARFLAAEARANVAGPVAAYRDFIEPLLLARPPLYPGSPAIAAGFLRRQDRMIFCDAYPPAMRDLASRFARDPRVKTIEIDGYVALNAFVPPVERRGLVLIDPPFEVTDEFDRAGRALQTAWRKWPTGIYMFWFPIKHRAALDACLQGLVDAGIKRLLLLELHLDQPQPQGALAAAGLVIVNPPHPLETEARLLLPFLAETLGVSGRAGFEVAWLAGE